MLVIIRLAKLKRFPGYRTSGVEIQEVPGKLGHNIFVVTFTFLYFLLSDLKKMMEHCTVSARQTHDAVSSVN